MKRVRRICLQAFLTGVVLSILISPAIPQSMADTEHFIDSRYHLIDLRDGNYKNGLIILPQGIDTISAQKLERKLSITTAGGSTLTTEAGGWSSPVLLVAGNRSNTMTAIAVDSGDHLHVVYQNRPPFSGDEYPPHDIYYKYYDGVSWSAPVELGFSDTDINLSIDLAVDSQDNLHMVWEGHSLPYDLGVYYSTTSGVPKIPLGGSKEVTDATEPEFYRIYIPTRWGGTLTVTTDNGWLELYYPDTSTKIAGPDTTIIYTIPFERDGEPVDEHGWYYVKCGGTGSYIIRNTFVQTGEASCRPWNFWYWPFAPQDNPKENLYGDGGPLEKYDTLFMTEAKPFEKAHYSDGLSWEGHCLGASIASILMPQPEDIVYNLLSQEEVEGLVSKLANTQNIDGKLLVGVIPPVKPQQGEDATDKFADDFHIDLLNYLRIKEEKKSLYSDLRDPNGIDPTQVWNHAIYKYTSFMQEAEEDREDIIKVTTTIYANADLFPSDDTIDRKDTYVYKLKYTPEGKVYRKFAEQDWISATSFAPGRVSLITSCRFDGNLTKNPYVTKKNVEKLGVDFP